MPFAKPKDRSTGSSSRPDLGQSCRESCSRYPKGLPLVGPPSLLSGPIAHSAAFGSSFVHTRPLTCLEGSLCSPQGECSSKIDNAQDSLRHSTRAKYPSLSYRISSSPL